MFFVELIASWFLDLISKQARWNAAVSAFLILPTLSTSTLFICFWMDLVRVLATTGNNVCGRRLYACINTRKFKGLDSREITSLPEIKKVIYIAVISIIAESKSHAHHKTFAYNKSLQHPTIAVLLIKIRIFFFDHSVVFTCSKVINAFKQ